MLEDGAVTESASFLDYRGTFRDDGENKTERATDDGQQDESVFGESLLGGSSTRGGSSHGGRDGDRGNAKVTQMFDVTRAGY